MIDNENLYMNCKYMYVCMAYEFHNSFNRFVSSMEVLGNICLIHELQIYHFTIYYDQIKSIC